MKATLARDCPRYFVQHPISDVAVAPKSDTKWYVVLAVKFLKPGMHYHFGVAKIEYITAGKQGWQYYRLPNLYLRTVSNPQLY